VLGYPSNVPWKNPELRLHPPFTVANHQHLVMSEKQRLLVQASKRGSMGHRVINRAARNLGMKAVLIQGRVLGAIYALPTSRRHSLIMDCETICGFTSNSPCSIHKCTNHTFRMSAHHLKDADMEPYKDLQPYAVNNLKVASSS
jgi:hypothetical protein